MCSRLYFIVIAALITLMCSCQTLPAIVTMKCGNTICPNNGIGNYCFNTCEDGIPTQGCCPIGHLCINTCDTCGSSICKPKEICQFCRSDPRNSKCCPIGALCSSNCTITAINKLPPAINKIPSVAPVALFTQSSQSIRPAAMKTSKPAVTQSSPSTRPTTTKMSKPTKPSTCPTAKMTAKPSVTRSSPSTRPTRAKASKELTPSPSQKATKTAKPSVTRSSPSTRPTTAKASKSTKPSPSPTATKTAKPSVTRSSLSTSPATTKTSKPTNLRAVKSSVTQHLVAVASTPAAENKHLRA